MKTVAVLLFAFVLCVAALSDDETRRQWQEFQQKYQKSYRSPVEAQKRFTIFKKHLEEIEAINKLYDEGKSTWQAGVNQFSDMTDEEMKEYMGHGILLNAFASEDQEIQRKWNEFQATYKKSYRSPVEAKKRFEIFKNNVIKMEEHNDLYEQGLVSDKQGINQFSDMTEEEFKKYVNRGLNLKDVKLAVETNDEEIEDKWNNFQAKFRKSYRSPVEAEKRFEIFRNNVIKMEEHNDLYEQGLVSDKQGINQFSDMTEEEFKEYVNRGLNLKDVKLAVETNDEEIEDKWNNFQAKYRKSYRSPVEAEKRFEIFRNNVIKMEEHNDLYEQGLVSDKQGINQFSDMTEEEFKEYVNRGLIHDSAVDGSEDDLIRRWNDFQKKYGKTYSSPAEAQKRFEIFKENVKKIDEHNAQFDQGKTTWKMDVNMFSDWTHDELVDWLKSH